MEKAQWKIGGEAGFGIMTAGQIFAKTCTRGGLYVFLYTEYPSLIRGGHNTTQVIVSKDKVGSHVRKVDVLVALNKETITLHKEELAEGAAIIYDPDKTQVTQEEVKNARLVPVPFSKIAMEVAGAELMSNNVALGASIAAFDYDLNILLEVIGGQFKGKGQDIISKNLNSAKAGYEHVKKNFPEPFRKTIRKASSKAKLLLTGNESIGTGAIAAGCKFYSGYPMTPTSSLLHFMASQERKFGLIVKQAEDEISVVNIAIGAAHVGTRAMVGTSGGGFCLMTEGYGLAAMTETPLVLVLGMRGGPSTGLPTWTEQGDLKFALHSSHGEFPRVVLMPGDHEENFYWTMKAFNIAEKFQTPVILITDKHMAEGHASVDNLDPKKIPIERGEMVTTAQENYLRYKITESGVSPRTFPGVPGNIFVANSDEHDERGISTEESHMRIQMFDKRMRKIQRMAKEIEGTTLHGPKRADITIVAWGSTKGAINDAIKMLAEEGIKANFLQILCASPFPKEAVEKALKGRKPKLMIELNSTGQMHLLIKEQTGIDIKEKILIYDGRPLYPEDVAAKVKKVLGK